MGVNQIDMAKGGPRVSRLALGFWRLVEWGMSDTDLLDLIPASLDLGITTFDHADIYGDHVCQKLFGRALALEPALREKMQLVTKCGIMLASPNRLQHALKHYDTSRAHIFASVEESLRALGTNQIEVSVLFLDLLHDGTVDQCLQRGIAPMVWSPLAGGRIFTEDGERADRVRQALQSVGQELGGASLDQVALAWLLDHPVRFVPILGSGKIERIRSAVEAGALHLSREQWFAIWSASTGTPVP